jgi:VanZ family protein
MSNITRKRLNILLIVLVALTLAFIWGNSSLQRTESSGISQGLLADICQALGEIGIYIDPTNDHWLRKLAHFSEFGLLGVELCLLMFINKRQCLQGFSNCAFAGLAAAVTDESIQIISERGSQVQDVLLDFCGFLTGLLLCGLICALVIKKHNKA